MKILCNLKIDLKITKLLYLKKQYFIFKNVKIINYIR